MAITRRAGGGSQKRTEVTTEAPVSQEEPGSAAPATPAAPRTTALIVAYNCIEPLRRTLQSLLAAPNCEETQILVVDNASQDGSNRVDQEYEDVTVLRMPHYMGLARARNIGMRTARGEFLLLLAPGVEVEPDTAAKLAEALTARTDALAVAPMIVGPAGEPVPQVLHLPARADLGRAWRGEAVAAERPPAAAGEPFAVEMPSCEALLLRRQTIQGINYHDSRFGECWVDADLCRQMRRASRKILLLPEVRVTLRPEGRWEPQSVSERAAFAADAAVGGAAYLGKQDGFVAGVLFRIQTIVQSFFRALGKTLTFSEPAYHWGVFARIASGEKLDGGSKS